MSVYYVLRQQGGEVEGPAGIGRLVQELENGSLPGDALVCLAGGKEWERAADALDYARRELRERNAPVRTERTAQKVRTCPYRGLSWSMILASVLMWISCYLVFAGLLSLIVAAFAVLIFVAAFLVDRKVLICSACGNRVEKTSAMCPTCRSRLR